MRPGPVMSPPDARRKSGAGRLFRAALLVARRPGYPGRSLRRHRERRLATGEVEAVEVHHLGPRPGEVLDELLLPVKRAINLGERPQLSVRAEDEIDARAGPLGLARLPVAALVRLPRLRRASIRCACRAG